jgi:rhodanese-related sulfurtransferase/predicted metal-dependent enzyme (double-stranded beta helix superfamily)
MTALSDHTRSSLLLSELASLVHAFALSPHEWIGRVRLQVDERWYERLELTADYEVWAISWLPGQATGFHDHGGSAGAFAVAFGALEEHRLGVATYPIGPGQVRVFGPHDVHDVRNGSSGPAVSIHAYSPPLSVMNRYELAATGLIPCGTTLETAEPQTPDSDRVPRSIDEIVATARATLRRLSPEQAYDAVSAGATLIDIRPAAQRAIEGEIPGALIVERNVLEWRLDPASDARLPVAAGYDLQPVVLCSAGYASSLAAASLHDLGLRRATDIIGGFQAWRAAGLPTTSGLTQAESRP